MEKLGISMLFTYGSITCVGTLRITVLAHHGGLVVPFVQYKLPANDGIDSNDTRSNN